MKTILNRLLAKFRPRFSDIRMTSPVPLMVLLAGLALLLVACVSEANELNKAGVALEKRNVLEALYDDCRCRLVIRDSLFYLVRGQLPIFVCVGVRKCCLQTGSVFDFFQINRFIGVSVTGPRSVVMSNSLCGLENSFPAGYSHPSYLFGA